MTNFSSSPFSPQNFSRFSNDFTVFTPTETCALSILVGVVSFFGTAGNLLVIVNILNQDINSSVSENPTNLLLLSQAIADLLVSCASGPVFILSIYERKANVVSTSLGQLTGAASVGNLVLLTLNRFVSIQSSLQYPRIVTAGRTKAAIALSWTTSLILGILTIAGCLTEIRQITRITKFYIIPSFFVIAGCYIYMYKKARHHMKEIKRTSYHPTGYQVGLEKDLKSVFSLLIVSGTFFVTWTPFTIFTFVSDQEEDPIRYYRIFSVLLSLIILNSAVDPVIYYFRSAKFRQGLRNLKRRYRERRIGGCEQMRQLPVVVYRKNDKISCEGTPVGETVLETVGEASVTKKNSHNNEAFALAFEYSDEKTEDNLLSQVREREI